MDNCGAELAIVGPIVCCLPTTENVGFKHYPPNGDRDVSQSKLGCLALPLGP